MTGATDSEVDEQTPGAENDRSVIDDVKTLFDDGVTYAEAEIAFQKTRLSVAGNHAKRIAIFAALAAVMLVFALFALVFGAILALAPHVTAWGATAIVVAALLGAATVLGLLARSGTRDLRALFKAEDQ